MSYTHTHDPARRTSNLYAITLVYRCMDTRARTPEPPSAERGMYVTRIRKFAVGRREVEKSLKRVHLISRNLPFI